MSASETCKSCGGEFKPCEGVVPILKCEGCGRELPGTALPKMTAADYQDGEVLEYFAREGRGLDNSPKPLAGLKLEVRASRRHAGGYSAGYRCWSCRLFVSGPTVTCSHCGQPHGGVHHEAYASR